MINDKSRNTRQKTIILNYLKKNKNDHDTAEDIYYALKNENTPVARATVYRYLAALEKAGDVRKFLVAEDQPACYQYIGGDTPCKNHFHFLCTDCGEIIHFESDRLEMVLRGLSDTEDFFVDEYKSCFYGKCKKCSHEIDK